MSEDNEFYLKDIKHTYATGENVCDWKYIQGANSDVRVYYKPSESEGNGFLFYAIEHAGKVVVPETENNEWHPDYTLVECLYRGVAYFDGIRHLYMGDEATDNYGYHYYVNIEANIDALQIIRYLEKEHCRDKH